MVFSGLQVTQKSLLRAFLLCTYFAKLLLTKTMSNNDFVPPPVISKADLNKAYRKVARIDEEYQRNVEQAKAKPGDYPLSTQLQPWFFATSAVVSYLFLIFDFSVTDACPILVARAVRSVRAS